MKKYLYEVRPNRPVVTKEGRTTRCPFSDLLTKEDVMGYMKSANIWRRFPDGVVRVTGQNLDLLHRETMNSNYSEANEENLSNSEVKVTVVEPKEEEIIPVETVEENTETAKEVVEEVETPVEESKEEVTPVETVEENTETVHETTDTVSDSSEDAAQVDENTSDSEVEEVKNEVAEEVTVVSQEEPKKEHQNVIINTGNQNRNIQVNSKNNKNYKR